MRRYAVLLLLAALSMLLSACGLMPAEDVIPESPTIASYEQETQKLETVMRGDLASVTTVDCKFMPAKKESLSFSVDGTLIGNIHVALGASVEAGQVVAELSNNLQQQILEIEYQKRVQQVKKRHLQEARDLEVKRYDIILSHLEQELERAEAQVKPIINLQKQTYEENRRSKLADYDSKIQAASDAIYLQKLQLNNMKEELNAQQLTAGINGTVTYVRSVPLGTRSTKDQVLVEITDLTSMAFTVSGPSAKYFPIGTEVLITCQEKALTARSVDPTELGIVPEEGQSIVYLKLDQPDTVLREGDRGKIQVTLEERKNVLYLRKKAIQTSDGQPFVYMLDDQGLRFMQKITTGMEAGGMVEILSGLNAGDQVLVD